MSKSRGREGLKNLRGRGGINPILVACLHSFADDDGTNMEGIEGGGGGILGEGLFSNGKEPPGTPPWR